MNGLTRHIFGKPKPKDGLQKINDKDEHYMIEKQKKITHWLI